MASSNFLLNAVKGPLKDTIDKARTGAPAAIDKGLAATGVSITSDKAKAGAAKFYASVSTATAKWLPSAGASLARAADKLAVWAKTQIEKL